MKKLIIGLLALTMVLSMSVTSFAQTNVEETSGEDSINLTESLIVPDYSQHDSEDEEKFLKEIELIQGLLESVNETDIEAGTQIY